MRNKISKETVEYIKTSEVVSILKSIKEIEGVSTDEAIKRALDSGIIFQSELPSRREINRLIRNVNVKAQTLNRDRKRAYSRENYYGFFGSIFQVFKGRRIKREYPAFMMLRLWLPNYPESRAKIFSRKPHSFSVPNMAIQAASGMEGAN